MNKNMNKRFFAEFVASLSLRVNPLPAEEDEPEINVIKDKLGDDDDSNYIDVAEYTQYTVHSGGEETQRRQKMFPRYKFI